MAQLPNHKPKIRKRKANVDDTNPHKKRKINSDTTNSIEEKESDMIVFSVKITVDQKDIFFDCYKNIKDECQICFESKVNCVTISPKCKHAPKYCLSCIRKSIESNITQKGLPQFKCDYSQCKVKYDSAKIFPLLTKRNLQIIDKLLLHKALSNNIEFRWCKSAQGCGDGQLVGNWQNLRGYYSCNGCGEPHCFQHEILWHSGFSCAEYEKELKANPNRATNAVLSSFTKKCPNCPALMAKLEGCDVMTCCQYGTHGCTTNVQRFGACDHGGRYCGQVFCWKCLGKIDKPKGGGYRRQCKKNCQYAALN